MEDTYEYSPFTSESTFPFADQIFSAGWISPKSNTTNNNNNNNNNNYFFSEDNNGCRFQRINDLHLSSSSYIFMHQSEESLDQFFDTTVYNNNNNNHTHHQNSSQKVNPCLNNISYNLNDNVFTHEIYSEQLPQIQYSDDLTIMSNAQQQCLVPQQQLDIPTASTSVRSEETSAAEEPEGSEKIEIQVKQNVYKSIMNAFKKFLYEKKKIQALFNGSTSGGQAQTKIDNKLKQLSKFLRTRSFNHHVLKYIALHETYSVIFTHFINFECSSWLDRSKITDKQAALSILEYLRKSLANKSTFDEFVCYKSYKKQRKNFFSSFDEEDEGDEEDIQERESKENHMHNSNYSHDEDMRADTTEEYLNTREPSTKKRMSSDSNTIICL